MRNWTWRVVFCVGALLAAGWIGVHLVRDAMRPPPSPWGEKVLGPCNASVARLEAKQQVAHAVVAGRMTLLQAAAAFKALDARYESYPGWEPPLLAADSDEEAYCRMVIGWVDHEAPTGQADEVAGHLRAELAARLRDGTLHLPEADGLSASGDGIPDRPAGPDGVPAAGDAAWGWDIKGGKNTKALNLTDQPSGRLRPCRSRPFRAARRSAFLR